LVNSLSVFFVNVFQYLANSEWEKG
jgi:hypothetical protein